MTDAYRTAAFLCPSCDGAPLREYGKRLVCDTCGGILLTLEEFASQLSGREVSVVDDGGATRPCPRCLRPMRGCVLVVAGRHLDHALVRCERDGIWFGDGSLVDVYEEIGRTGPHGGPRGDGGFGYKYGAPTGRSLLRRPRKLPPREHSAPVPPSALRERAPRCPNPACAGRELAHEVTRWSCRACAGVFVENAALEVLIGEMAGGPWELPPPSGAPGGRLCPACAETLTIEHLEGVTVDRCAAHGVWFDPAELEAALQHAAGIEPSSGGPAGALAPGSWLRRLFSRP